MSGPAGASADYVVVDRGRLADSEFQGAEYGAANVSLIFIDIEPGQGPRLHRHPYQEIFVLLEGRARFTVGSTVLEARAGQIIIVHPGVAHKFVNSGPERLRQIDVHSSASFITEWLEE